MRAHSTLRPAAVGSVRRKSPAATPTCSPCRGADCATLGRAFELAMCLAPIKTIHEGSAFAQARGRPFGVPAQAAMLVGTALRRWDGFA
jgi:hypothetical protein